MLYAALAIAAIAGFAFCYYQNNKLDKTYYTIESETCAKDFKILHLSDFHSKPFAAVLRFAQEVQPDMICITGDFINDRGRRKTQMLDYAKALCAVAPVYYITGNHERRLADFEEVMQALAAAGFCVLRNEVAKTPYCAVLGLDENQADFADYKARKNGTFVYPDMQPYFEALEQYDGFRMVLSHFPENFEGIRQLRYAQYDFDLQLSGHAHGGQWIFPFLGPLFSPGQGVLPKYARGTFGTKPKLIVSRGLGNSEFPLRLFNHPEALCITVTGKETQAP